MADINNGGTQPLAASSSAAGNLEMSSNEEIVEESRRVLRRRWELASVLNFLHVFEPVFGKELEMSAEEIETALIVPNDSLAKLHITLLKGIPPVNKNLSNHDAWVTILCKKLAEWWPWVAEGEVPLTAGKGEEISRYKELDPTIRLSMLKALCELRTEQDDLMTYINDALKEGTDVSHFRIYEISGSGSGTSFWYDGDSVMGYRLYREVKKPQLKSKNRRKGRIDLSPMNSEWETLATNLDEFRRVLEELSSSTDAAEEMVYQTIETEVIPELEKLKLKQERKLKRRQTEEARLNSSRSYGAERTCRTRKPVKYTFDEYDRSIEEAIKVTRMRGRKDPKVERNGRKLREDAERGSHASDGDLSKDADLEEGSPRSTDEDEPINGLQVEVSDTDDDANYVRGTNNKADGKDSGGHTSNSDLDDGKLERLNLDKLQSQGQKDLVSDSSSGHHSLKVSNLRAKSRLRQRPTQNSALETVVVRDSDHGSASDDVSPVASSEGYPSEVPDSEDEMSS